MTRYPDNLFDPMCTDQAGCIYLQRYKAIFHFMDDNAEKIVNSDDQAKEKADKFKKFDWKIIEITGSYLVIYDNYGKTEVLFIISARNLHQGTNQINFK